MEKETCVFAPKARLIQILGEHLIKDAAIGLLELIKNSYDADATQVDVIMIALHKTDGKIIIRDNGCGMSTETFLNRWMNPASGYKERQKQQDARTSLGRLPLGEKGVGRFAAHQIGNELRILSKTSESSHELLVEIDWREFELPEKDLCDVKISYHERESQYFQKDESGTILEISSLKQPWTEADIDRVSQALKRLKSPFKGAKNFDVALTFEDCPVEFLKYGSLETTAILNKAHYKLFGTIDVWGNLEFEYHFSMPGHQEDYKKGKINLITSFGLSLPKETVCGGFTIYLYAYETSTRWKWLQRSHIPQSDIDEWCGIHIYRDGIRLFPYGEKGYDWLELDSRSVRMPSNRFLSNDNIIGLVEITQTENPQLKDKTNREGLIENVAFKQLKTLVFATVRILEKERIGNKPVEVEGEDIEKTFQAIYDTLAEIDEQGRIEEAALKPLLSKIHAAQETIFQILDEGLQENQILFRLAGTGLAAERFTHEFARLVRGGNDALNRLKKLIVLDKPKVKKEIDIIYESLEALRNDIRLLGPMFYVKRVANEKALDVRQIIQNTLYLQEHWLKQESIQANVQGETFTVKMREGSCMQIFNNLIDNSIFWLSRKSEVDRRIIRIIMESETSSVFVSDSGAGVTARYRDKIFEPFFSMRGSDGRGLGLYIVKEILEEKNWDITLVTQDDYPEVDLLQGASFKITFVENA